MAKVPRTPPAPAAPQAFPAVPAPRHRLLAALATMPEEAFFWLVQAVQSPTSSGPDHRIWPDAIGGFTGASRAAITEARAAADTYHA